MIPLRTNQHRPSTLPNARMIEIVDLVKTLDGLQVLKGVNLLIEGGQTTAIIGSSGAGKSVLLKHIIGLLRPNSGRIIIDGIDTANLDARGWMELRKEKLGMLFQEGALFDSMNVYENVAFFLAEHTKLSWKEIEHKVEEKLEMVNLRGVETKMPSDLSGGMKKRVALARAIIADPEILLLDEPTAGLDPVICASIMHLIKQTQERLGITFVMVTHNILAGFSIAQKIAMLHDGKIVASGTAEEMRDSKNPVVQSFLRGVAFESHLSE